MTTKKIEKFYSKYYLKKNEYDQNHSIVFWLSLLFIITESENSRIVEIEINVWSRSFINPQISLIFIR